MASNRTSKRCFESQYGGEWITAAQWLAELACERIAGNTTLPVKFWNNEPWKAIFRREITHANRLLATPFAIEVILRAWLSREGRRVRTLGAPFFKPLIEIEQRKFVLEKQQLDKTSLPESVDILQKPRQVKRAGKSIREKLDNGSKQNKNRN